MPKLGSESEVVEYKESLAERDTAGQDLCALANKRGGVIYFGVKNNGQVVGLNQVSEKTLRDLTQYYYDNFEPRLLMDIDHEDIDDKNVIKITVRPGSEPYHTFKSIPWIRVGPVSKRMSQDEYHRRLLLYKSTNKDFSSSVLAGASINDLSPEAITELRRLLTASGRMRLSVTAMSDEQLLRKLHLIQKDKVTVAAIVLLGSEDAFRRYLPYAEIRYGFKISDTELRNQDTEIFTGAYLLYYNRLWQKINSRNISLNIPYGMQLLERKAFDEESIREGVNNVVTHRDYSLSESAFVIQYQTRVDVKNPGGFPEGITPDNIITIDESKPRNKLIADVLYVCELVEQFGNGVNLMVTNQLSLGKSLPDYMRSDDNHVLLSLDGKIQDVEFAKYVLAVAEKENKILNDNELLLLNRIKGGQSIIATELTRNLTDLGLIEQIGRRKFMLSKQYYKDMNLTAQYTRQRGLSRGKNKQLILQHIHDFNMGRKADFRKIFNPGLSDSQIDVLLRELKNDGYIYLEGKTTSTHSAWKLTDAGAAVATEPKS